MTTPRRYADWSSPQQTANRGQDFTTFQGGQLLGAVPSAEGFVTEQEFRTTQNDWGALANLFREAKNRFPDFLENWMMLVGNRIVHGVLKELATSGQNWTKTYSDSFSYKVETAHDGTPELYIGHLDPVGENVDRLHIYWKVMETGAKPNPRLSGSAATTRAGSLYEWSVAKSGNPKLGLAIALANRQGRLGISARPVLSKFFVLAGENLTAVGLTPLGRDIVMKARSEAYDKYLSTLNDSIAHDSGRSFKRRESFRRRGRTVSAFRDVMTGQFTKG
jgi:hypothetical protein